MTMPHANSGLAEAPHYESDADKSDEEIAEGLKKNGFLAVSNRVLQALCACGGGSP